MLSDDNPSTRQRSVRAALDVVRDEGIQRLTTRAIARRSGLTQPAIYRHFGGKEDLVRQVLGEIRLLFYSRLMAASGAGRARERLFSALAEFAAFAIDEPRLFDALFLEVRGGFPSPPPLGRGEDGNIFAYLVERVTDCGREGDVGKGRPVAITLTLAAHAQGLALLYRQGRFGSRDRFVEFFDRSMSEVVRAIGSRPLPPHDSNVD